MRIRQLATQVKRFAATANVARKEVIKPSSAEKISHMPNGLVVYSADLYGPVSQLMLAFRAGSRFEQPDEVGLTHHLRNSVGTDSENAYGVQMLWQCGNAGVNVVSHLTRDLFAVQTSVIREHAGYTLRLLGELGQPAFKPWDFEETIPTLTADLAYMQPYDILMDKLHYAAYRAGPLGNALYAPEQTIGKLDFRKLCKFAESRMVSGQACLVGINIGHDDMLEYVDKWLKMRSGSGKKASPSKYLGGEARHPIPSDCAHVAIAGEGASLQDKKALATQAVLVAALGQNSATKYGPSTRGLVSSAVFKASNGYPYTLSTVNEAHSDSGLVGFYLSADADKIAPLVHAAVNAMKTFSINNDALQRAKSQATMDWLMRSECSSAVAVDRCAQLLATNAVVSPKDFVDLIDDVKINDLQQAIKIVTSKLSLAAYGNVYQTPYLDQL